MGAKGVPTVATEAAVLTCLPGSEDLTGHAQGEAESVKNQKRQANQDKRKAQKRRRQAQREELQCLRTGTGSNTKGKGNSKGKSKDQAGQGPRGQDLAANYLLVQSALVVSKGHTHTCRICLSPSHQDDACPAK